MSGESYESYITVVTSLLNKEQNVEECDATDDERC